jgi:hypothetical protein
LVQELLVTGMVRHGEASKLLMLPNTLFQTGVIVTIQVQLLTSNSMAMSTISRAILSLGIIFELLGTMLAVGFLQHPRHNQMPKLLHQGVRFAERLPLVLISFGIVGLAVVLLMDIFKTSY